MNFNFALTELSGEPILDKGEPLMANKRLAKSLIESGIDDYMKWNEISRNLWKGEKITLDKSDKQKLIVFIEKSNLINGVKEQLITVIKNEKD